jgi:NAD(P)-dependent dehydrogenase (short-subunit alcohol dehydrogenase family)
MYPALSGRVAIVTGAGRRAGLGAAIARKLATCGVNVLLHELTLDDETQAVAEELRELGVQVGACPGDVQVEADVEALVAHAVQVFGRLDILVNNAGIGYHFGPILEMTQEKWDATLNVNLRGCFFGIKHAGRQMVRQGSQGDWGAGRIVSIGSRASKSASALTAPYAASKHGLVGLSRAAAVELGPQRINVNVVCPNHVTTDLGAWQNQFMSGARGQTQEEYLAAMRERIPLGRVGLVTDTANAVAFLCSGEANYITGEAMNVSGGEEYH